MFSWDEAFRDPEVDFKIKSSGVALFVDIDTTFEQGRDGSPDFGVIPVPGHADGLQVETGAATPGGGFHVFEIEHVVDPLVAGTPGDAVGGGPVAVDGDGDEVGALLHAAERQKKDKYKQKCFHS